MARTYTALYTHASALMADQLRFIHDGRFDYVQGSRVPQEGGGWVFQIELTEYFSLPPNDAAQLAGLSFLGGRLTVVDQPALFRLHQSICPTGCHAEAGRHLRPATSLSQPVSPVGLPKPNFQPAL